ncbi:hypothetical protein VTI28DRAFT_6592 [Corynascus sepedonium]
MLEIFNCTRAATFEVVYGLTGTLSQSANLRLVDAAPSTFSRSAWVTMEPRQNNPGGIRACWVAFEYKTELPAFNLRFAP